jgi:hypothetical protein
VIAGNFPVAQEGEVMSRRTWAGLAVVALATLVALPTATAAPGGTERPFAAAFVGVAYWEFPGDCDVVTTLSDAEGIATHLGLTALSSTHCPASPEVVLDGHLTLVAANGDELLGRYDYDPASESNVIALTFAGGTGRFADASGHVTWTYDVVPELKPGCDDPNNFACYDFSVPWQWSSTMVGVLSS